MPRVDHDETGVPCWADLATPDPEGAVRFYTTVFGWEHEPIPTSDSEPSTCSCRTVPTWRRACARMRNQATARCPEQTVGVETEDLPMVESGYKTFSVGGDVRGGILQVTAEWEGVPRAA